MVILLSMFIVSALVLLILKPASRSVQWMEVTIIGWLMGTGGYMLFLAKYGGFYDNINTILFITDGIRQVLLYSPIDIDGISRLIVYGRSIFIFGLFALAYHISGKPSSKLIMGLYVMNAICALGNVVIYDPNIYREILSTVDKSMLRWVAAGTRIWLIIAFAGSIYIVADVYFKSIVPWIKRRLMAIMAGMSSMIIFYFYIGFMGPMQVTDPRTYYFLYSDFSNFNLPISSTEWYIGIIVTGISCIAAMYSFGQYIMVERDRDKDTLYLDLKFRTGKMSAKVFTHGIKNQLIMLQLLAKRILDQKDNLGYNETADTVIESAAAISGITNSMLDRINELSRTFNTLRLELKPVSVQEVISEALTKVKYLPENIEIINMAPDKDITIIADKKYLADAIYNIIDNAIEAVSMSGVEKGKIIIDIKVQHKYCAISISDNGIGMDNAQMARIFDPFYTSKNTVTNWGVGLSYSQSVIRAHFGNVQVKSKPGIGSTFYIFLPMSIGIGLNSGKRG